jgi:hypothetical protein
MKQFSVFGVWYSVFNWLMRAVRWVTRSHRILMGLAACGVLAVFAALSWPREREPAYHGRRLSEWVRVIAVEGEFKPSDWPQERFALSEIGTNGLPFLLKAIGNGGLPRNLPVMDRALGHRDGILRDAWVKFRYRDFWRATGAARAIGMMGPLAEPAIPGLSRMLVHSNEGVAMNAAWALAGIGPAADPVLISVFTNTSIARRIKMDVDFAIWQARDLGKNRH